MATQHYSIVNYSFPMTKKESLIEDCIVIFLTEKFVQIVFFLRIPFIFFFFHGHGIWNASINLTRR